MYHSLDPCSNAPKRILIASCASFPVRTPGAFVAGSTIPSPGTIEYKQRFANIIIVLLYISRLFVSVLRRYRIRRDLQEKKRNDRPICDKTILAYDAGDENRLVTLVINNGEIIVKSGFF